MFERTLHQIHVLLKKKSQAEGINISPTNHSISVYLNVLLPVDIHVDQRAETDQTLPHFHIAFPRR